MNFNVYALAVLPNGDLVAGGAFDTAGGVAAHAVARWNGSSWSAMGTGLGVLVDALAVSPGGDLYAGGFNGVARWNEASGTWTYLAPQTFSGQVETLMFTSAGDLFAGGSFAGAASSGINGIARWNGTVWSPLGSGVNGGDGDVTSLVPLPNGSILAGGFFTSAGGLPASRIARWDGFSWSRVGAGFDSLVSPGYSDPGVTSLAPIPVGGFAVAGFFTQAGGFPSAFLARYQLPTADFDGDGDAGTDADIQYFFACLSGTCCPACGSADFNGDGDVGTDQDIDSFFRVLAGGPC
jgi:hypothetical protein